MKDIRQTQKWAEYLQFLGWEYTLIDNNYVYLKRLPFGSVIKIQRVQNISEKFLKVVDNSAKENQALFVKLESEAKLNTNEAKQIADLLTSCGYKKNNFPLTSPATIQINLKKPRSELWEALDKDAKYSIKRAEREEVIFEEVQNPDAEKVKEYFDVFTKAGKEKKYYTPSLQEFNKRAEIFADDILFYGARKKGSLVSVCTVFRVDNAAFYMQSGTIEQGRKSYANYFLLWKIIESLSEKGLEILDLDGVNDERFTKYTETWAGFSYFKRKFGGEEIKFLPPYIKYFNPVLEKMEKFMGSLPL